MCAVKSQLRAQRAPYGDQSYITDGNAVRVRVWGKADEYLCKCTSLSLSESTVLGRYVDIGKV